MGVQQVPPDETQAALRDSMEAELVEPGVWRIPVPLPFALRSANVYLIAGAGEYILVDAGLGTPDGDAALRAGLGQAGVPIEQITTLVLTHEHPDHIGLSGVVHAASGAPVRLLAEEAERMFAIWGDPEMRGLIAANEMYLTHGMPEADMVGSVKGSRMLRRVLHLPPPSAVVPMADGATLRLAGMEYRVIWTPGHSDYHMCLLREDGLFIAGDHVLPRITPNIGVYPNSRPNPLRDYYEALAAVRDLPVRLVLPGHGRPFADLARRVEELRMHHEERAGQTLMALARHPTGANAYTLAGDLFGERLRTADDHRFALVETLAHLEDLRAQGRVENTLRGDRVVYAAGAAVSADS